MNRRAFLKTSLAVASFSSVLSSCKKKKKIKGGMVGASAAVGHLLRDPHFSPPAEIIRKKVVIVGGGVSGLSAGYFIHKGGETDFVVLDLENEMGGNARSGANGLSAYPWGAHYIPTPNEDLPELSAFLQECGVITGYDQSGLPSFNEAYLCFDPQERLYINGRWQDGLVPHFGVPPEEQQQIRRFLEMMDTFRYQRGSDGKYAFSIPVDTSSRDTAFTQLDRLTMKEWLLQNEFTSAYLHWYVNYCTRDDFGTPFSSASAWIGIHYFASRKGKGANATHSDVLTWPEGNGFLIRQLSKPIQSQLRTGCLATQVQPTADGVRVTYFDLHDNKTKAIEAEHCVMAVPQFVGARLLNDKERLEKVHAHLQYAPWMVANLTVSELEERSGAPLSWDNVLYNSASLGYVEATHELLQQHLTKRNLTYYLPLTGEPVAEARNAARQRSHKDWVALVIKDLEKVHPNIEEAIEEVQVMIWGHAMAQPVPGMIFGGVRQELGASLHDRIHFAHTDLAGASIFEEGFYKGLAAAKKIIG